MSTLSVSHLLSGFKSLGKCKKLALQFWNEIPVQHLQLVNQGMVRTDYGLTV